MSHDRPAVASSLALDELGLPRIPPEDLRRIAAPNTQIWGRHDRALRLELAETG